MEKERQRDRTKYGRKKSCRAVSVLAAVLAVAMAVSGFCFAAAAPPAEGTADQYRVELIPVTSAEESGGPEDASASYPAGTEFEIGIRVSGGDYAALQLYLTYDSSHVSYTGKAEAAQESSQLEVTEVTSETSLFVTLFGDEMEDGSTAAVLTFTGIAEGEASFGITAAQAAPQGSDLGNDAADWLAEGQLTGCTVLIGEAADETVTVTLNDSYLSETGAVFSGLTSGSNPVTPDANRMHSFTLTHTEACVAAYSTDGGVTYTALTATAVAGQENTYRYSVPAQEGVIVAAALRGDADLSGTVSVTDAAVIARSVANNISLSSLAALAADGNASGTVQASDAAVISRSLLGYALTW